MGIEVLNEISATPEETPIIHVSMANPITEALLDLRAKKETRETRAFKVLRATRAIKANLGLRGLLDLKATRAFKVCKVLRVKKATLDRKAQKETREILV